MKKDTVFLEWYQDPMAKDFKKAVLNAISHHGPITDNHVHINSVVKRIYGVFKAYQKGQYEKRRRRILCSLKKNLKKQIDIES